MTIGEQLTSMPEPIFLTSEWRSGNRRLVVTIGNSLASYTTWHRCAGFDRGEVHECGPLRDGNHLAELYRWLVQVDE